MSSCLVETAPGAWACLPADTSCRYCVNFGVEAGIQSQGTARPHLPRQPPGGPATVGFRQGQRRWTEAAAGLALCIGTTWALQPVSPNGGQ